MNECTASQLDLFALPPIQTSIESSRWVPYKPVVFVNNTLEFFIPKTIEYTDLTDTELYLKVSIRKSHSPQDTVDISKIQIGPINNLFDSLFSQIEISFNNTPVENTNNTYAYRAYIENLLNYNQEAKKTHLRGCLFSKDMAGEFENITIKQNNTDTVKSDSVNVAKTSSSPSNINTGFINRRNAFNSNGTTELIGKLHSDLFKCDRLLLNFVDIRMKLTRSKDDFSLLGDKNEYIIIIEDATLFMRKAIISPAVTLAHTNALLESPAKYPTRKSVVKAINITGSVLTHTISNIHNGELPKRIIFGMVDCDAYNGNIKKNPFNFKHNGLTSLEMRNGSNNLYGQPLKFDFSNNNYMQAYRTLFTGMESFNNIDNDITYSDFSEGNALFVFNYEQDKCRGEHLNIKETGTLNLELNFEKLTDPAGFMAIFYLEFDYMVEITKDRFIIPGLNF